MDRTRRIVGIYCALAFGLTWACIAAFHVSGGVPGSVGAYLTAYVALLGPIVGAIAVQRALLDDDVAVPLGLVPQPTRWLFYAWGGAGLLALVALAIASFFPGVHISFDPNAYLDTLAGQMTPEDLAKQKEAYVGHAPLAVFLGRLVPALFAGGFMNGLLQLPSEAGFRGLVQRETAHLGFWRSSLLAGVLHGLWFLPYASLGVYFPGKSLLGALLGFLVLTVSGPLASYLRLRAGTVVASALARGAWNAVGLLAAGYALSGSGVIVGSMGWAALAVLVAANVVLVVRGVAPAEEELRRIAADSHPLPLTTRG